MSVLDDVKMGLAEKGQNLAEKAKDSAEGARQKSEIKTRETEMETLIFKIGAKLVRNDPKRTSQECPEEMKRILILNKEIKALEAAMRKEDPTKACRFCGKIIPLEARYCTECGRRQDAVEQPTVSSPGEKEAPASTVTKCPMCGAAIGEGATECVICGYKVNGQ